MRLLMESWVQGKTVDMLARLRVSNDGFLRERPMLDLCLRRTASAARKRWQRTDEGHTSISGKDWFFPTCVSSRSETSTTYIQCCGVKTELQGQCLEERDRNEKSEMPFLWTHGNVWNCDRRKCTWIDSRDGE